MATITSSPSKAQIISLIRSFIRLSRQIPFLSIREYAKRGVVDAFRQNATLSESSLVFEAFPFAMSQLEVVKRWTIVYLSFMEHQSMPF